MFAFFRRLFAPIPPPPADEDAPSPRDVAASVSIELPATCLRHGCTDTTVPPLTAEEREKLKAILLARHGRICVACRTAFPHDGHLQIDHRIPVSRFVEEMPLFNPRAAHHLNNLQLLCAYCNQVKRDRLIPLEALQAELLARR